MPESSTGLQLSASSLQDFVDCPRRFQLRYVLGVQWPAQTAEPDTEWERRVKLADDFHRSVNQHLLGLPLEALAPMVDDPELARWWQAYLAYVQTQPAERIVTETVLSIPLGRHRLAAKYDALFFYPKGIAGGDVDGGPVPRYLIVDWKTYHRQPSRRWLAERLQTCVYPLVLVQGGAALLGDGAPVAEDIAMRYWLAEFPGQPVDFIYSQSHYRDDMARLVGLVREVDRLLAESEVEAPAVAWSLTQDSANCRFCLYRSLCERGEGGRHEEEDAPMDDFEQQPAVSEDWDDLSSGQVIELVF